jgi:hypothetical protein
MNPDHKKVMYDARKAKYDQRNEAMRLRFAELYEQHRVRFDDCIDKLSQEFFLSPHSVRKLIKK